MRLKLNLLWFPGDVLRVIREKYAKNRWQRKSAITYACAAAETERMTRRKIFLDPANQVTCNSGFGFAERQILFSDVK